MMGLCLAGSALSAMAELAPACATPAIAVATASPALHEPALHDRAGATAACPAVARQAAQLHLYDTPVAAAVAPPRLVAHGRPFNDAQQRALALAPRMLAVARAYDIDPLLLHAIAHVESRHNPQARSSAGALGVLQVMPDTARRFGIGEPRSALVDPAVNIEVGAAYLKSLQARFGNDLTLVLAAYNAGEAAVERHGRSVPPYPETRDYVRQVLAEYRLLRSALAQAQASAGGVALADAAPSPTAQAAARAIP